MRGVHLSQYFRGRNGEGLPPITSFLKAGCGFGGSCLPKDVNALIVHGRRAGIKMPLLESVIEINEAQPHRTVDLLRKHWPTLKDVRVAVLGLSFKAETSDVRESPAFPIMRELLDNAAVLTAYDPVANHEARQAFPDERVTYCDTVDQAIADADAIVVVTPWKEFATLPAKLNGRGDRIVFVDGRRAFDKKSVANYEGIGL
jgi:UDPglucose 6-dehydrogenase/GDP-mannose 6-dehydrogenase